MTAQTLTLVQSNVSETDALPKSHIRATSTALIFSNPLFHAGLHNILKGTPFALCGAVSAHAIGQSFPPASQFDLVIIEATQNTSRLPQIVQHIKERSRGARIVVLADQFDLGFVQLAHTTGVAGYCLAGSAPAVLVGYLELVMAGEAAVPVDVLRSVAAMAPHPTASLDLGIKTERRLPDPKACKLSARELQILACLREGAPNKAIARKFDLTEATIKVHVKAILRKIGVANRTQAAMWAVLRPSQRDGISMDV